MKILLVGAGESGSFIAKYLSEEDLELTIIDSNPESVRAITDTYSISGLTGDGKSLKNLNEADIKNTNMVIATTASDEANMIICQIAGIFKVPNKIAYLKNSEYLGDGWQEFFRLRKISVDDIISPVEDLIKSIKLKIQYSHLDIYNILSFFEDEIKFFSIDCEVSCLVINKTIFELEEEGAEKGIQLKVGAILRNNIIFIPSADDIIYLKDKLFISTITVDVEKCYSLIYTAHEIRSQFLEKKINNVILCGNGRLLKTLAISINQNDNKSTNVKVISSIKDEKELDELATELTKHNITCISDDITKRDYRSNYLNENDIIIVANESDRDTSLDTLLLKQQDIGNIFCCLHNNEYTSFLLNSGIKQVSVPHNFILNSVLLNIRRGIIFNVFPLFDKFEVIELEIARDSIAAGQKIQFIEDNSFKILTVFNKENKPMVVSKNLFLQAGDRVLLIANRKSIDVVEATFSQNSKIDGI